MSFKDEGIELYTPEDKARLSQGLKPELSNQRYTAQITDDTVTMTDDSKSSVGADQSRSMSKNDNDALLKQLN